MWNVRKKHTDELNQTKQTHRYREKADVWQKGWEVGKSEIGEKGESSPHS